MKNKIIIFLCSLFILGFFIVVFLTMCEAKKENKTIDEFFIETNTTIKISNVKIRGKEKELDLYEVIRLIG